MWRLRLQHLLHTRVDGLLASAVQLQQVASQRLEARHALGLARGGIHLDSRAGRGACAGTGASSVQLLGNGGWELLARAMNCGGYAKHQWCQLTGGSRLEVGEQANSAWAAVEPATTRGCASQAGAPPYSPCAQTPHIAHSLWEGMGPWRLGVVPSGAVRVQQRLQCAGARRAETDKVLRGVHLCLRGCNQ